MGDCPSHRLGLKSSYERQALLLPCVDGPRCSAAPETANRIEASLMVNTAPAPLFTIERLGVVMAPEPGNPLEVEGVLNPAGVVGPDGHFYLFPRLVAAGNYSRIGVARVRRDVGNRPIGVERLGVVLEPEMSYEIIRPGTGGCEDPRITYLPYAK